MYSGKRSPEAEMRRAQRRAAKEYIITFSFNDYLIGEKVSRTDPEDVLDYIGKSFGHVENGVVPCTFKGVVLTDGRGQGVFQK